MLKSSVNLNETNGTTREEVATLLEEAYAAEEDLRQMLSKIKIHIDGTKDPEIITAIESLFGKSYISSTGNSTLTYNMYCSVLNLMRQMGKSKAEELL